MDEFWGKSERWPRDAFGKVFLARAVEQAGSKLFEADWTDTDSWQIEPPYFGVAAYHKFLNGTTGMNRNKKIGINSQYLSTLMKEHYPDLDAPTLIEAAMHDYQPSPEEYSRAYEIFKRLSAKAKIATQRFEKAKSHILEGLQSGKLMACLRPVKGGAFSDDVPLKLWNSERIFQTRFTRCQMNMGDPFGNAHAGTYFEYIFVDESSLQIYLKELNAPAPTKMVLADVKRWLIAEMKRSPNIRPNPNSHYEKIAKDEYGCTRASYRRIRKEAILETGSNWDAKGSSKAD